MDNIGLPAFHMLSPWPFLGCGLVQLQGEGRARPAEGRATALTEHASRSEDSGVPKLKTLV
jgi:hypothetical protein